MPVGPYHFTNIRSHFSVHVARTRTNGLSPGTFQHLMLFTNQNALNRKRLSLGLYRVKLWPV